MTPRTLPDTAKLITNPQFKGMNQTLVRRDKNVMFVNPPKVNENIVAHKLSPEEAQVYLVMKNTLTTIQQKIVALKLVGDTENVKRFSSYLLALITYLRQSLVCPIIPLTSIAIDMADYESKSELSKILTEEVNKIGLFNWLNNIDSVRSSRINRVMESMNAHGNERVVLFSCFRTCLDVLKTYIPTTGPNSRPIFNITSDLSLQNRGKMIDAFKESKNGVLLLTYELGAEGLNLQCASVVLLLDFWWNSSKTQQAIARVVRFGQTASVINVYFFTSNTGVEQAIFKKHKSKLLLLDELKVGPCSTKIHKMTMNEILALIQSADDNAILLKSTINHHHK
jgi:SNF2 family DNA or RNA helicase